MKQAWSKEEIATIVSNITDKNIEANPTLEGDEETLSSIGIKGVNYAVGGGSEVHLYKHVLTLVSPLGTVEHTFYDDVSTAYTKSGFARKYGTPNGRIVVTQNIVNNKLLYSASFQSSNVTNIYVRGIDLTNPTSELTEFVSTFTDTVTQIF